MSNTRLARIIFLFLFFISVLLPLFYINDLPHRMASHFDINNQADGWMSKNSYVMFHYGIIFLFFLIFWGLNFFIPRFPISLINIPNKEYWLNETRSDRTFMTIQAMMYWLGSTCFALFIFMSYEIIKTNLAGSQQISSFSWASILVFLSANAIIILKYILYFTKKENQLGEQ